MARSDKKGGGAEGKKPAGREPELQGLPLASADIEHLSALQLCDFVRLRLQYQGADGQDLGLLRARIEEMEEIQDQARTAVEQLSAAVEKLRAPALRLGTLIQRVGEDRGLVCVGGTDYVCNVDPALPEDVLAAGTRVLLNEAFAVTDTFGLDKSGPVVKIAETLTDGRLRVGEEAGTADTVVLRSAAIGKEKIKAGTEVRLDANRRVAVEIIGMGKRLDRTLANIAPLPWSAIGGQEEAVRAIRDSIELPLLHQGLFQRFKHSVPKGFLLYGPPGCGKTLLGPASTTPSSSSASRGRRSSTCGSASPSARCATSSRSAARRPPRGTSPSSSSTRPSRSSAPATRPGAGPTSSPPSCRCSAPRWTASRPCRTWS
jgi:proteasome-associated ATPase